MIKIILSLFFLICLIGTGNAVTCADEKPANKVCLMPFNIYPQIIMSLSCELANDPEYAMEWYEENNPSMKECLDILETETDECQITFATIGCSISCFCKALEQGINKELCSNMTVHCRESTLKKCDEILSLSEPVCTGSYQMEIDANVLLGIATDDSSAPTLSYSNYLSKSLIFSYVLIFIVNAISFNFI